jgi:hypothetical protein
VHGALGFKQEFVLEDAIGSQACWLEAAPFYVSISSEHFYVSISMQHFYVSISSEHCVRSNSTHLGRPLSYVRVSP